MAKTSSTDTADARRMRSSVTSWSDRLVRLSHSLHQEPETALQEHKSATKIADLLESAGFDITRGAGGLPTALVGTQGSGDLVIGLCAEYDALPGIGHACGHNVNGAAAVGAAIALGALADDLGLTVKLIGTPAEEDHGGKVTLLEAGVFDDVAAAMMVHAGQEDSVGASSLAVGSWDITYDGRAAHAASAPWDGVNALDAMALAYTAVGLLRQQLPPDTMVHGIVVEGGQATNVIPARTRAQYEIRAPTSEQLRHVQNRARACFQAGALATGALLDIRPHGNDFAELVQDEFMTASYLRAAQDLGRTVVPRHGETIASTDMGNISQQLPAIQPMIGYDTHGSPHHTLEFASHGTSPGADLAVVDGAIALSRVGIDLANTSAQRLRLLDGAAQRRTARPRPAR